MPGRPEWFYWLALWASHKAPHSTPTPSRRSQACLSMAHNPWKTGEPEWAFMRWEQGKAETIQPRSPPRSSANAVYVQFKTVN